MSTLFAALLLATPAQADPTWPSGRPAEGLTERLAQTSPAELGPMDCTPASGLIAARLLELPVPDSAVVAVTTLRQQARWPLGSIGMPLSRLASALERSGAVVSRLEDGWLSTFAAAIERGGVAVICGRNAEGALHAVALSGYDPARDTWIVHDPDSEVPLIVSRDDLRRFREDRCEDRLDLVVMPSGSKRFRPPKGRGVLVKAASSARRPAVGARWSEVRRSGAQRRAAGDAGAPGGGPGTGLAPGGGPVAGPRRSRPRTRR